VACCKKMRFSGWGLSSLLDSLEPYISWKSTGYNSASTSE
jgi:hypothetical protein